MEGLQLDLGIYRRILSQNMYSVSSLCYQFTETEQNQIISHFDLELFYHHIYW